MLCICNSYTGILAQVDGKAPSSCHAEVAKVQNVILGMLNLMASIHCMRRRIKSWQCKCGRSQRLVLLVQVLYSVDGLGGPRSTSLIRLPHTSNRGMPTFQR